MIRDYTTTLTQKDQLTENIWRFVFSLEKGESIDFIAGQYMLLKINDSYRQYSISSPTYQKESFEIILEVVPGGLASTYLKNLNVGEVAYFKGPAGVFTLNHSERNKIFLATGTGIAPMKSMIDTSLHNDDVSSDKPDLYLLFGLKTKQDMYLYEEFRQLASQHARFHFFICLSRAEDLNGLDPRYSRIGRVNKYLNGQFVEGFSSQTLNDNEYYICGSRPIVDSLREFLISLGINREVVFFENFTV